MEQGKIIPFYMAYPMPLYYEDEKEVVKDMEYLQSQHSVEIRALQREVMESLNIIDYSGSMIYDEYPDRFSMTRQCKSICEKLKKKAEADEECPYKMMVEQQCFDEIVMLLLCDEMLKRRHQKNKGYLRF